MCINIYDVRLTDTSPACGMNWPPNLKATYEYLHRDDVRTAFHVNVRAKPEAWIECNPRVSSSLSSSIEDASVTLLPDLLDKGLKVLIFAGDQDLICNHIGLERMIENLQWQGSRGFSVRARVGSSDFVGPRLTCVPSQTSSARQKWLVNDTAAGTWQEDRNLTYVSVAGASHMVGVDAPVASHDMMLRFMNVDVGSASGASAHVSSQVGSKPDRFSWSSGIPNRMLKPTLRRTSRQLPNGKLTSECLLTVS